jgi:hypothetical protein
MKERWWICRPFIVTDEYFNLYFKLIGQCSKSSIWLKKIYHKKIKEPKKWAFMRVPVTDHQHCTAAEEREKLKSM